MRCRLFAALILLAVVLSGRWANSDEVEQLSIAVPVSETVSTSEYYRKHGLWLVPATMNNQPAQALLGTGSNVTSVHAPKGADSFPDVRVYIPPSNSNPVTVFANMPFQCLGLPIKSDLAMGSNFTGRQDIMRIPLTAIVGSPYLRHGAFVLDPSIAKIETVSSPVDSAKGVQLAVTWIDGAPRLPVTFPILGTRNVVFETGSTAYVWLSREKVDALERMGQLQKIKSSLKRQSQAVREVSVLGDLSVLRFIEFGGIRFHNVPVVVADKDMIGLGLLAHFRTTLDFPTDQVWCEKLDAEEDVYLLPPTFACAPFFAFHNAEVLEVVGFNEFISIGDHGLEKGDRVLKLNGMNPKLLSEADLQEILSKAGTTVSLDMQRGKRRFSVKLKLELSYQWPPKWESEKVTFDSDFEASLK